MDGSTAPAATPVMESSALVQLEVVRYRIRLLPVSMDWVDFPLAAASQPVQAVLILPSAVVA